MLHRNEMIEDWRKEENKKWGRCHAQKTLSWSSGGSWKFENLLRKENKTLSVGEREKGLNQRNGFWFWKTTSYTQVCFFIRVQRIGLMIIRSLFRNGRGGPSNVVGTPPSQNVDPFTSVPAWKLSVLQYWMKYWTVSQNHSVSISSFVAAENGQASAHPSQFPTEGLPLVFYWFPHS